jgi:hypothetical protein
VEGGIASKRLWLEFYYEVWLKLFWSSEERERETVCVRERESERERERKSTELVKCV